MTDANSVIRLLTQMHLQSSTASTATPESLEALTANGEHRALLLVFPYGSRGAGLPQHLPDTLVKLLRNRLIVTQLRLSPNDTYLTYCEIPKAPAALIFDCGKIVARKHEGLTPATVLEFLHPYVTWTNAL